MLTRDQVRVARLLDPLPESGAFAFAGGAAVIAHGLVQRSTVDLDYFASKPHEVARLLPAAEGALVSSGYEVHRIQIATETDFARLDVRQERGDPLGLDLAYDYRMRPTVETELGRTLHQEELAADKVLALFGRAEARDFRDVDALVASFGHERLLQLAPEKDPGFSADVFRQMLGGIARYSPEELQVSAEERDAMVARFEQWQRELAGPEPGGPRAGPTPARSRTRTYYRPRRVDRGRGDRGRE